MNNVEEPGTLYRVFDSNSRDRTAFMTNKKFNDHIKTRTQRDGICLASDKHLR